VDFIVNVVRGAGHLLFSSGASLRRYSLFFNNSVEGFWHIEGADPECLAGDGKPGMCDGAPLALWAGPTDVERHRWRVVGFG